MNTKRVGEIRARAEAATPDLREEEPGWIVSQSLPVSGSRVYSPHVGINFNRDYYLFLHAREDILYLCDEVARLSSALHSSRAEALEEACRAACIYCASETPTRADNGDYHHPYPVTADGRGVVYCLASRIRNLSVSAIAGAEGDTE
jgi:hypothetical protein